MRQWQLSDAKTHIDEIIKSAATQGPQKIVAPGEFEVVLLSKAEYERMKGKKPRFVDFMRKSQLRGCAIDFSRDRSPSRNIDL